MLVGRTLSITLLALVLGVVAHDEHFLATSGMDRITVSLSVPVDGAQPGAVLDVLARDVCGSPY